MPRSRSYPFMEVEVTALCHHPGSLERADECTSRGNRFYFALPPRTTPSGSSTPPSILRLFQLVPPGTRL